MILHGAIRRKVLGDHPPLFQRFPDLIFDQIDRGEMVVIWQVLNGRRDPGKIRKSPCV